MQKAQFPKNGFSDSKERYCPDAEECKTCNDKCPWAENKGPTEEEIKLWQLLIL